ncbi:MAG: sigma-70 family RNA polymerase sigma factor [Sedimentisphaerales bacterium]|nr:sigma-70 family RNA polymerase sigma factor [Sedimentisphaerales bacterium]
MSDVQESDRGVLEAIRRGDAEAWSRLIDEYQGRLLRFALARVAQPADAEDIVQETFTSFIRVVNTLQIHVSLETYLFGILRNEIVNRFRTRWARAVCLIQDVYRTGTDDAPGDPLAQVSAPGPSVTWCVSRDEEHRLQQQILGAALRHLVGDLQKALKFRDLKIAELVFYCQLANTAVARLLDVNKGLVRVVKHRCLKRIRADVLAHSRTTEVSLSFSEDLLTEAWEEQRLSCPKRSTLGAFLLETLSPEWFDYVDFHLTTLGCHFCRASFKDLQEQQDREQHTSFRRRILTSTAGFLSCA